MTAMSSLKSYNQLAANSREQVVQKSDTPVLLGCQLPDLVAGQLTLNSQRIDRQALTALLVDWQQAKGWYQTSGELVFGVPADATALLQGQWHLADAGRSLHVQLEQGAMYRICEMTACDSVEGASTQCYRQQHLLLRQGVDHSDGAFLCYRLWWQLGQQGTEQGLWQPLMQQFIGFARGEA